MFQCTGPLPLDTRPVLDSVAAFAAIISMMVEAQSLEAQLEVNATDPALANICDEAEALWSAAASRLLHFSQSTFCPGCIADAAGHLAALVLSDGSDPGQDHHHLSSIVLATADASIPAEAQSQLVRAARLLRQVRSVKDPFICVPAHSSISPIQEGY